MQSLYTLYIVGLNLILKIFSEDAVMALGIYYKLQTFFFIPLFGLQQVIVPIISYKIVLCMVYIPTYGTDHFFLLFLFKKGKIINLYYA